MPQRQTIRFQSDQYELVGTLHRPDTPNPPFVIGCHGLFADRQSPKQIALAETCTQNGIAYLRFDHRGCGQSQGDFNTVTSLTARCTDLKQAMQTMQRFPATGPCLGLFGSSFGGTVVLAYSARNQVPRLVTFAAPYCDKTIVRKAAHEANPRETISSRLARTLQFDLTPQLSLVSNILVVHGQDDELVPVDHARYIHARTRQPKKLIIQPRGDHRMSDLDHQRLFQTQFLSWLQHAL